MRGIIAKPKGAMIDPLLQGTIQKRKAGRWPAEEGSGAANLLGPLLLSVTDAADKRLVRTPMVRRRAPLRSPRGRFRSEAIASGRTC